MNCENEIRGSCPSDASGKEGVALLFIIAAVAVVTLIGACVFTMSNVELDLTRNDKDHVTARYQAEAGIQYVYSKLVQDVAAGVVQLAGAPVSVNYAAPSGYNFDNVTWVEPCRVHSSDSSDKGTNLGFSCVVRKVIVSAWILSAVQESGHEQSCATWEV